MRKLTAWALGFLLALGMAPGVALAEEKGWSVESASWQDQSNLVLTWQAQEGVTYEVYRSNTGEDAYEFIGTSSSGSYRDDEVWWPYTCFYKVRPVYASGERGALSEPIESGENQQSVSKVTVLMYHNFITEEDIQSGVEFEEYSLDPEDFREDLEYFRENGYTTITSADFIDYIDGKKPLPKKAVIVSIDDGTWGVYKNCWPLLKEYGAKADFNIIGENVDETWYLLRDGGSRDGQSAPYCTWEELVEMQESGEVNLCSHTYGLHRYNVDGRIGASMMEGESVESYASLVAEDYRLSDSCIGGWTGVSPTTMAYPYSKRSTTTDEILLASTGYQILMGGQSARGTESNYFVDGASPESQLRIMSRPCRMDGHPAQEYLEAADAADLATGAVAAEDTAGLTEEECAEIALWYSPFADVAGDAWYAGSAYYTYANSLISGTSPTTFSPEEVTSRAMVATVLYRMEGSPDISGGPTLSDVPAGSWYEQSMAWAAENGVITGVGDGRVQPERGITREEMATVLYRYASARGVDTSVADSSLGVFNDADAVSSWAEDAVRWAVGEGILRGIEGGIAPQNSLTRAEMATMLMRFSQTSA